MRGIPSTKRGIVINHGGMANYTMTPVFTHPLPKTDMEKLQDELEKLANELIADIELEVYRVFTGRTTSFARPAISSARMTLQVISISHHLWP